MIRIVLVRPQGPRNAGAVARVAANFGPAEIFVVAPARASLLYHPDFEQMSHGVEDVAGAIRTCDELAEALADTTDSVGFTARGRQRREIADWRSEREEIVRRCNEPAERVALVFGNEETGLSGEDTALLRRLVRIPTASEHTSLNLAMAVGIVLSSAFFERAADARSAPRTPLKGLAREYLKAHVRDTLGAAARSAKVRAEVQASVERVFGRAEFERRDARAWHAVMRALGNRRTPADYGLEPARAGERRERALRRARLRESAGGEASPGSA